VPRASLLVVASSLPYFKIPDAGVLLILAVDHFLDMGRTATNTVGNSIAAASVAKWEGAMTISATTRPPRDRDEPVTAQGPTA
jgi:Na+/H+-dicarboxylate symporter